MKKLINLVTDMVQAILTAPVKLPEKVLKITKYVSFGLSLLKQLLDQQEKGGKHNTMKNKRIFF